VSAADDEMRLARDRPQGRLRVDVPVAFGKYLLTPALSRFTQRYPLVAIEVRYNDRFVDLAAEGVDVAVRAGSIRTPDLIAKRIATSRLVTCGAPAYFAVAGIPRTPADLKQHRNIGYLNSEGARPSWTFRQGKGTMKIRPNCALAFNTTEPVTLSAMEGQGIMQATDLLVSGHLAEGRLVEVLRDYSCEGPALSVVYPRATQHLAKVRVFVEFAAALLRDYEARVRRAP
jgi:DNA-binding transcriptional LysR family regulator